MVAAGEVDAAQMTPAEIWEFVEPDELFKQFDFGRSCPGHVNFDKDYHDWAIAERGQLLERSTALINAMLLPLGKDMMDLLLDSAMAGRE